MNVHSPAPAVQAEAMAAPTTGSLGGVNPLDLRRLLSSFRKRLRLFGAVALAVFVGVALFTAQATPRYTATAKVMLDTRQEQVSDVQAVLSGVTVDSRAVDTEVEVLRFHGIRKLPDGTRDVTVAGGKFNLPDVNAAVGLRQLVQLPAFNAKRQALVARYFERFRTDPACELPHPGYAGDDAGHSWNMFAPLLPLAQLTISRQEFRAALEARGIGTGMSYEAAHLATAYRRLGYHRGDLPHTEHIADTTVTLPLFPMMTEADVDRVCAACADVLATHRR